MPATITTIPQVKQEIRQDATPGGRWRRSSRRPDGKPASLRAFLMEKGNPDHAKVRLEFAGGGAVTYGHPVLKTAITEHYHGPQALFRIAERTDVKYRFYDDQAKQEIWLFADPGTNVFEEVAWLEDVELLQESGGRWVYRHVTTGEVVGHIPAPVVRAFNAGAGTLLSTTATMTAEPQADGSWLLRITVDADWLAGRFAAGDVVVIDPTTVTTTTITTLTGEGYQHRLNRCQNGVLWLCLREKFWYSQDNGQTWTDSGSDLPDTSFISGTVSFFIDLDDYAHVVYALRPGSSYWYYRRGTPNAERTSWTWSSAASLLSFGSDFGSVSTRLDVVAHREGTGWKAHVAIGVTGKYDFSDYYAYGRYRRVNIASDGTLSVEGSTDLFTDFNSSYSYPLPSMSIDFTHNGDGKTVSGSPHIHIGHASGSAFGVYARVHKGTYSSGSWTIENTTDLDSDIYSSGIFSAAFDGTRFLIAYAKPSSTIKLKERNVDHSTTTDRTPPALSDGDIRSLNVTYDAQGNIWLMAVGTTSQKPKYIKYDRPGASWGSWTVIEDVVVPANSVTSKRGEFDGGNGSIEVAYVAGSASPYDVRFEQVWTPNQPPYEPTLSASPTAFDAADGTDITIEHNDPDAGDTMSAYALKRDVGGTVRWWNASTNAWDQTSEHWNAASGTSVTITKANNAGTWTNGTTPQLYAATKDAAGEAGPYNATAVQVTVSTKPTVSIDTPAAGGTITTDTLTVEWTYFDADGDAQSAYRVRLLDADNADAVLEDTGWVSSSTARSRTLSTMLENNHNYKVEVRVKDANGVESA